MKPPNMTVSPSQMRTYGAGGFLLDEHEEDSGCPRKYKAKYVEHRVPEESSYALGYGGFFHQVLYRMEEDGLTPEEALDACFPAHLPPEAWTEARDDLTKYLERGATPMDRFATVAVEEELRATLYVDPEFGEVFYRGIVDWMGIDPDDPETLHVVDYKTNRHPPSEEDVRGDVQMKAYHWLAMQNRERWGISRVVVHFDAVKWREVEARFTEREIEDWHGWAVAVVRKILRDDEAKPMLNPGCAWCPVREDCPAFLGLPKTAEEMAAADVVKMDDEQKIRWRDAANAVRLTLEKAVKAIDEEFKQRTMLSPGELVIGSARWSVETEWSKEIDLRRLHDVLGDDEFYDVVATSEAKLKGLTKDWAPSDAAAVLACISVVPSGSKVKRGKVVGPDA